MRVPMNISSILLQLINELTRIIDRSPRLINPLIVYRGIKDETHLRGLEFINPDFISTSVLINSTLKFAEQIDFTKGNTMVGYNYGVYEITVGPTIPCIYMESITMHEYEFEILLPPGLLFKTDSKIFYKKLISGYVSKIFKHETFVVIIHATVEPRGTISTSFDNYLIDASHHGDVTEVERLLRDPRINPAAFRNQAIKEAAQNGHIDVVELLLRDPRVDPSDNNNDSLILAIRYKKNEYMAVINRLLQDPRVDPSAQENYSILQASLDGNFVLVDRLLQDPRVDPSAKDNEAIISAVTQGFINVVDRLLRDPRVDPSAQENLALIYAIQNSNIEMIDRLLLDRRVDPSTQKNSAIISASRFGQFLVVERLLQDPRVDPSAQDNLAIRKATENNHVAVVELLMRDPRVAKMAGDFPKLGGAHFLRNSNQYCRGIRRTKKVRKHRRNK